MRKRGKVDANQKEIVERLRKLGFSVQSLANIGDGFPDIVVGKRKTNWLFEVKIPHKPTVKKPLPHADLTDDEKEFFNAWQGQADVITCLEDALTIMNRGNK